jgi:hypothetical protein
LEGGQNRRIQKKTHAEEIPILLDFFLFLVFFGSIELHEEREEEESLISH